MLPLRGVCSLVDKDENKVLELIESGKLAWVFDVSLARTRKELRIVPAAAACLALLVQSGFHSEFEQRDTAGFAEDLTVTWD